MNENDEISFTSAACGSKAPRVSGAEVTDIDIARHSERGVYYGVCSIFCLVLGEHSLPAMSRWTDRESIFDSTKEWGARVWFMGDTWLTSWEEITTKYLKKNIFHIYQINAMG